ncbi:hypothetical protein K443DRAFT_7192 [Laccaria amethystina LaAM-08-1]|uniref:Uncharacterized protein n=1 Tax=Laccaria amethystina LaAM-08-1 TaxID=1095629 RepID=A0A0C9XHN8_9AGAR|nr:hypothetical protein K443DRAFT_7192 [Laccaria amethystina LaAM-08-1]
MEQPSSSLDKRSTPSPDEWSPPSLDERPPSLNGRSPSFDKRPPPTLDELFPLVLERPCPSFDEWSPPLTNGLPPSLDEQMSDYFLGPRPAFLLSERWSLMADSPKALGATSNNISNEEPTACVGCGSLYAPV